MADPSFDFYRLHGVDMVSHLVRDLGRVDFDFVNVDYLPSQFCQISKCLIRIKTTKFKVSPDVTPCML